MKARNEIMILVGASAIHSEQGEPGTIFRVFCDTLPEIVLHLFVKTLLRHTIEPPAHPILAAPRSARNDFRAVGHVVQPLFLQQAGARNIIPVASTSADEPLPPLTVPLASPELRFRRGSTH